MVANITCSKCDQKGHYSKDCPNSAGTGPMPDQTLSLLTYSHHTMVTKRVTASHAVSQYSLMTILRAFKGKTDKLTIKENISTITLKARFYSITNNN